MKPARSTSEVLAAIDHAKSGAVGYCTNFFPVERRLQEWIERQELFVRADVGASFFFRKDRDFHHVYFAARDVASLRDALERLPERSSTKLVLDLVGKNETAGDVRQVWQDCAFQPYGRLQRMMRIGSGDKPNPTDPRIELAMEFDAGSIMALLEREFDIYGEQVPNKDEIAEAVRSRQILAARQGGELAGILYFESQGVTSTLRFWAVAEKFRSLKFGSALMRSYLASQSAVKRFLLWVACNNRDAISKYGYYGYKPDGMIDEIMANKLVCA